MLESSRVQAATPVISPRQFPTSQWPKVSKKRSRPTWKSDKAHTHTQWRERERHHRISICFLPPHGKMPLLWDQVKKDLVKFEKLIGFTKWLYSEVSFNLILVPGSNHTWSVLVAIYPQMCPQIFAFAYGWRKNHMYSPNGDSSCCLAKHIPSNPKECNSIPDIFAVIPDENNQVFLTGLPGTFCSNLPRRRESIASKAFKNWVIWGVP